MKLENKYCTALQSEHLFNLKLNIDCGITWACFDREVPERVFKLYTHAELAEELSDINKEFARMYMAYDAIELGVFLGVNNKGVMPFKYFGDEQFNSFMEDIDSSGIYKTEANTRACVLIWLLENHRITVAECRERFYKYGEDAR